MVTSRKKSIRNYRFSVGFVKSITNSSEELTAHYSEQLERTSYLCAENQILVQNTLKLKFLKADFKVVGTIYVVVFQCIAMFFYDLIGNIKP